MVRTCFLNFVDYVVLNSPLDLEKVGPQLDVV